MFTGLVEEVGTVRRVRRTGKYQAVEVTASTVLQDARLGDSIAIDGACQTVTDLASDYFAVETLAVSLEKTTLGEYRPGRRVNLERALTPQSRLGGHFVQGHVDAVATVADVREKRENVYFTVALPKELLPYCVSEGSITVDGVSLTIAGLSGEEAMINVIPSTWRDTVLRERRPGATVNIEVDIIGRYVARFLGYDAAPAGPTGSLTAEKLKSLGY